VVFHGRPLAVQPRELIEPEASEAVKG
jgi:hypothetical protein